MHRDLRDTPEWPLLVSLHHQGVPLDTVAELVGFSQEEIVRAFDGWTGAEKTRPKVAKDGTTTCPKCGHEAWPVRYGMWIPERDKPAPKAIMAGCVIEPGAPQWSCQDEECGYEWRIDTHSTPGLPDRLELMELHHAGLSIDDIGKLYGVEPSAVWTVLSGFPE